MLDRQAILDGLFPGRARSDWTAAAGEPDALTTAVAGFAQRAMAFEDDRPTADDPAGFPGFSPFARGRTPAARVVGGWDARQRLRAPDPKTARTELQEELMGGAASITLRLDRAARRLDWTGGLAEDGLSAPTAAMLAMTLEGVDVQIAPVALEAGAGAFLHGAQLLAVADRSPARRAALLLSPDINPIGALARQGALPQPLDAALNDALGAAAHLSAVAPQSSALLAS
ncbi:MAG: methylmalonyl-CoA mutase family protein, partial [Pseudomonadota bacterium]